MNRIAKNNPNRLIAILLSVIMIIMVAFFSAPLVYGLEAFSDDEPITLMGKFTGQASSVPGITLWAYKVADMDSEANFTVDETFMEYAIDYSQISNQEQWRTISETLHAYIARDGIKADYKATTDENGTAYFGEVEPGLYLIMGNSHYIFGDESYSQMSG